MPVTGSVAPIVIWWAVTPGTFLVAAPAPTMDVPAVTRPRHSKSAVPVIVTRRVLLLTILISPLDLELLLRERRRHEPWFQVTLSTARTRDHKCRTAPEIPRGAKSIVRIKSPPKIMPLSWLAKLP